jgi:hypothetical protein
MMAEIEPIGDAELALWRDRAADIGREMGSPHLTNTAKWTADDIAVVSLGTLASFLARLDRAEARGAWRCFHCDEVFTDKRCARDHFGSDETSEPACRIKAGAERSMLTALRRSEDDCNEMMSRLQSESTDAAKAYYAQTARHQAQLRAAEELGFERGIAAHGEHCQPLPEPPRAGGGGEVTGRLTEAQRRMLERLSDGPSELTSILPSGHQHLTCHALYERRLVSKHGDGYRTQFVYRITDAGRAALRALAPTPPSAAARQED